MHNKVKNMSSQPAAGQPTEEPGKMFVGGLSWATTQDTLRAYFAQFGEIDECIVMYDRHTFRSRGYGYVRFRDPACVDRVMANRPHIIDAKQVDPKPCCARGMERLIKQCKIFLGGLPLDANEAAVREFFSQFGHVVEAQVMFNPDKKRSRGFGFVAFDNEQVVRELLERRFVEFRGKSVELRRLETAASRVARNQHAAAYPQFAGAPNSAGYGRGAPNPNWNAPAANWMPPHAGGWSQNGAPNWMTPNGNPNWSQSGPAWSAGPNANWNGAPPANWQGWAAQPQYAYWNGPRMPDRMNGGWAGQQMYGAPSWAWSQPVPSNGPAWQAGPGGAQPQAGPNAYYASAPGPRFGAATNGMVNGSANAGGQRPATGKGGAPAQNGGASFGLQAR